MVSYVSPEAAAPPVADRCLRLATNFKAARFEADADTAMLRELADGIEQARLEVDGLALDLPVKLKVFDSVFVPLAKWAMLMSGNYRCLTEGGIRTIAEAVHSDLEASRSVYEWVMGLCIALGADCGDLVPFEKYAQAAKSLESPSSAIVQLPLTNSSIAWRRETSGSHSSATSLCERRPIETAVSVSVSGRIRCPPSAVR